MKQLLLLAVAVAFTATASAQSLEFRTNWEPATDSSHAPFVKHNKTAARHYAPTKATEGGLTADDIIYSAEGTEKDYYRKTTAYFVVNNSVQRARMEGSACKVTVGDDGTVYVYNPFTQYDTYSYIVGKRDGNKVTFHTPQIVDVQYNDDGSTTNIYATKFRKKKLSNNTFTFVADTENTDLEMAIDGDSIAVVGGDSIMLALTNAEKTWSGYGNGGDVARLFNDTEVSAPEGAEPLTYSMKCSNGTSKGVTVKFDGTDIYIKGIASGAPDSWVKGTINGNTITMPSMQYLGLNESYGFYFYLTGATKEEVYDPDDGVTYFEYQLVPQITMTLDADSRSFSTSLSLLYNAGKGILSYDEAYDAPSFSPFDDVTATPATPEITTLMDYKEDVGYGGLIFIQPAEDTEGNWINPDNLKYIVYADDTAYEFSTDLYSGLEENLTEVPYSFTDDMDFTQQDGEHIVYLYEGGHKKWGVQSVYYGGGQRTTSAIAYRDITGINAASATAAPTHTVFYDLQGRLLQKPVHGMNIMKATYADGSVKVIKYVAR